MHLESMWCNKKLDKVRCSVSVGYFFIPQKCEGQLTKAIHACLHAYVCVCV